MIIPYLRLLRDKKGAAYRVEVHIPTLHSTHILPVLQMLCICRAGLPKRRQTVALQQPERYVQWG
jgi:hypothetical protein